MERGIWTVKEWFFNELDNKCASYRCHLNCEYTEVNGINMADHTKLRVDQVLAETEKAYKVVVDADTFGGNYKAWTAWVPKSVVER